MSLYVKKTMNIYNNLFTKKMCLVVVNNLISIMMYHAPNSKIIGTNSSNAILSTTSHFGF